MKKKSSLSLSINAIVVLIIAITMLGLGLGFVKGMFGTAAEKFTGIIAEEQEPEIPTASNPVALSRGVIIAKPGQDQAMKVSLYNPTGGDWSGVTPAVTCQPDDFLEVVNTKDIGQGKHTTFGVLLPILGTQSEGTNLCTVSFGATAGDIPYSADFTVRIQYK